MALLAGVAEYFVELQVHCLQGAESFVDARFRNAIKPRSKLYRLLASITSVPLFVAHQLVRQDEEEVLNNLSLKLLS